MMVSSWERSDGVSTESSDTRSESKRIVIIGPVLPYRGGIAHHTTMLHRTFRAQASCMTLSLSDSTWLAVSWCRRQRGRSRRLLPEPGVTYVIDSVNPLTWRNALSCARAFSPSIVVFPWWNAYWAICLLVACQPVEAKDVEVVFLCHNVIEHEDALWKRMLSMRALSAADRFVDAYTSADRDRLLRLIPRHTSPFILIPSTINSLLRSTVADNRAWNCCSSDSSGRTKDWTCWLRCAISRVKMCICRLLASSGRGWVRWHRMLTMLDSNVRSKSCPAT